MNKYMNKQEIAFNIIKMDLKRPVTSLRKAVKRHSVTLTLAEVRSNRIEQNKKRAHNALLAADVRSVKKEERYKKLERKKLLKQGN